MSGERRKTGKPQLSFFECMGKAERQPVPRFDRSWILYMGISLSIIGDLQAQRKIFSPAVIVCAIMYPGMKKKAGIFAVVVLSLLFSQPLEVGLQPEEGQATLLADQGMPLQRGLMVFQGAHMTQYPLLMSGITITVIPIILIYLFMQKHVIAGITAGVAKG